MTNTNIKRTNGPWKTDPDFNRIQQVVVLSPDGQIVATCHGHHPVRLANARLIAVAPELLVCLEASTSALIGARDWINWITSKKGVVIKSSNDEVCAELNRLIDANQAALSKATGGAS